MILGCCEDCHTGAGMGSWSSWANPFEVVNKIVSGAGSVAMNIVNQTDAVVQKSLQTAKNGGATIRSTLQPQGSQVAAPPGVSYAPLALGGLAAAGLLWWALAPKKALKGEGA